MSWQDVVETFAAGETGTISPAGNDSAATVPRDPQYSKERWSRLVATAVALGAAEAEVVALFREADREDICMEPDESIPLHARTIAKYLAVKQRAGSRRSGGSASSGV